MCSPRLAAPALAFLAFCAAGSPVLAQDPVAEPPAPEASRVSEPPADDGFDWVKLTSGEWLKGEVLEMRKESLRFDSDKLGELSIDWSDVAEVHSPRPMMVLVETEDGDQETEHGVLSVVGQRVGLDGEKSDRKRLLAIVPGEDSEGNYWSGKLTLSLAARSGNTNQTDASSFAELRRDTASTRGRATYNGTYSELAGQETASSQRVNANFDVFLSRRLFVTAASFEYLRDAFQNIDYRVTPGAGLGYQLVDVGPVEWSVTAGGGYQFTKFDSVVPPAPDTDDMGSLIVGTLFEWDITGDTEFTFDYRGMFGVPDTESYNHHLRGTLSLDLWGDVDLDVSGIWDHVSQPATNSSGVTPQQDDFRLTVGLGWSF